ncbi:DUF4920 domain-containing protein [Sphingobacterium thalpophilum]|uniref:DUF4920 domain-containing protein n=1 Tax=Sphingobacterium thalpophilum TaxID=259 RepID=A0A4U9UL73_9SPHI|nr:DUF4920 domain-containing protein [Sphingobacterium thalpophilum]VTR33527.1 Uncharacterised protein [Sphingobacterium thalpophilum]
MKKIVLLFSLVLAVSSQSHAQKKVIPPARPGVKYGKEIVADHAITVNKLDKVLSNKSTFQGKIEGKVVEVCKKKGCFMTLQRDSGEPVMVRFKDYGFFMPADIIGRTVVVEGVARKKETSVADLQHVAKDLGKSQAEISLITQPKKDISIIADAVLVVK